tara:strand:- start:601 stop:1179 length:579 start_codon:yes stop_codon:yes gene_type:complete
MPRSRRSRNLNGQATSTSGGKGMSDSRAIIECTRGEAINRVEPCLLNLYENAGKDLEQFSTKYSKGEFEEMSQSYDYDVFSDLTKALTEETCKFSKGYKQLHKILTSSSEGLYAAVRYYNESKMEISRLKNNIAQLQRPNNQIRGLRARATLDNPATIKPEILLYIKRYGVPPNLAFETEKLAAILAEIKKN